MAVEGSGFALNGVLTLKHFSRIWDLDLRVKPWIVEITMVIIRQAIVVGLHRKSNGLIKEEDLETGMGGSLPEIIPA